MHIIWCRFLTLTLPPPHTVYVFVCWRTWRCYHGECHTFPWYSIYSRSVVTPELSGFFNTATIGIEIFRSQIMFFNFETFETFYSLSWTSNQFTRMVVWGVRHVLHVPKTLSKSYLIMTQITRWTPHVENLKCDQCSNAHTFNYKIYKSIWNLT
jgi:hypothetical protein